jgi:predicted nucleotidyltransferase
MGYGENMAVPYLAQIKQVIGNFDPEKRNRYFIFGSAARARKIHDIDLAVQTDRRLNKPLSELKDLFYDAPIPYKVDVVDIDAADADFRDYVIKNEVKIWI